MRPGEGSSTSNGVITIRTANFATSGVSGMLSFLSGTSKTGNRVLLVLLQQVASEYLGK